MKLISFLRMMISKYGTSNIFASMWFKENITDNVDFWLSKHGRSRSEVASEGGKAKWAGYTPQERQARIDSATRARISTNKKCRSNGPSSRLEIDFLNVVEILVPLDRQFCVSGESNIRIFDALIKNTNTLIEVNGDYWHANPAIYSPGD